MNLDRNMVTLHLKYGDPPMFTLLWRFGPGFSCILRLRETSYGTTMISQTRGLPDGREIVDSKAAGSLSNKWLCLRRICKNKGGRKRELIRCQFMPAAQDKASSLVRCEIFLRMQCSEKLSSTNQ